ncbi:MAG: sulfite exporter TauE/SafE family protein [Crocinitomicaceae bacterium]|nr:sulfite exporter TauE/SafE family protein [Crocinitomicaceae bacterium]
MDIVLLILVAFGASWLTFFSGFGLGTLLTPVFILLFKDPIIAIAGTAIVHFLNNVFKFILMKRNVNWKVAIPFGLAAIPAAFLGAELISHVQNIVLASYTIGVKTFDVLLLNVIFSIVLIGFALIEVIPSWTLAFSKKSLWLGGAISGFFGGLSGHQGALRTAFLVKYQLEKEAFIATGIVVALAVDIVRTSVYFTSYDISSLSEKWLYIIIALVSALFGAILGKFLLKKMNMKFLTNFISMAMVIFGVALALGWLNK